MCVCMYIYIYHSFLKVTHPSYHVICLSDHKIISDAK